VPEFLLEPLEPEFLPEPLEDEREPLPCPLRERVDEREPERWRVPDVAMRTSSVVCVWKC
jgi:hypothetical protein